MVRTVSSITACRARTLGTAVERADVLALPSAWHFNQWIGLVVLALVGWLLYRTGARKQSG